MSTFCSGRLTTMLALLHVVARQGQGFVVVPPRPSSFAVAKALHSTSGSNEVASMRAGEIKKELESYGISTKSFLEKGELVDALVKARAEGLTPKTTKTTTSTTASSSQSASPTSSPSKSSSATSASREERLKEELEKCKTMKASDMKKELEGMGVSTKSFFEKSEFAQALAEAKVDGVVEQKKSSEEGYAEYKNVEVLTDDSAGPRPRGGQRAQQQQNSSPFGTSPFGSASPFGGGGSSPFGDMGGTMGGIADLLKNMGGMGGAGAANPFGGGGTMGGMGDAVGKAQEMMKNPKVREIVQKAQSNPKMMAAVTECMSNPAAFAKYQNDPEVAGLINELRKYMM